MTTWTEIQEWVELSADSLVDSEFDNDITDIVEARLSTHYAGWLDLDDETRHALKAAVSWKTAEALANYYQKLAEGFCESYYLTLKQMHEEEQ